jgi:hypothetical protein
MYDAICMVIMLIFSRVVVGLIQKYRHPVAYSMSSSACLRPTGCHMRYVTVQSTSSLMGSIWSASRALMYWMMGRKKKKLCSLLRLLLLLNQDHLHIDVDSGATSTVPLTAVTSSTSVKILTTTTKKY